MYLSRGEAGEPCLTLRSIARSGLGWYPQKTIVIHPEQLQSLEILVKRARGLLTGTREQTDDCRDKVIPLPWLGCPAVTD